MKSESQRATSGSVSIEVEVGSRTGLVAEVALVKGGGQPPHSKVIGPGR
jgi:hypothetical protein